MKLGEEPYAGVVLLANSDKVSGCLCGVPDGDQFVISLFLVSCQRRRRRIGEVDRRQSCKDLRREFRINEFSIDVVQN